jgi:hypothetical protein
MRADKKCQNEINPKAHAALEIKSRGWKKNGSVHQS